MRVFTAKLSGSLMTLIIICFCLPFIAISCDHKQVAQLTGIQLVTGTKVKQATLLQETRVVPPQPWAVIPFGLAIVGMVLGFWGKGRIGTILQSVGSTVAVIALLLLKNKLYQEMLQYPKLLFCVEYLPCYWITLGLFACVAVVNVAGCILHERRMR
jgi:hypothetical protein